MEVKLKQVADKAYNLIAEHGLVNWQVQFNNRTVVVGETDHLEKTLTFSKKFIKVAEEHEFYGVLMHEIAHALLGPGFGHGERFIEKCMQIGVPEEYATYATKKHIRKYMYKCSECGYAGSHNSHKDVYCYYCSEENKISKLDVTENKLKLKVW